MYDRLHSPALRQNLSRRAVRQLHWRAVLIPPDWLSAHRAARIEARVAQARERHVALMRNRGRRF